MHSVKKNLDTLTFFLYRNTKNSNYISEFKIPEICLVNSFLEYFVL